MWDITEIIWNESNAMSKLVEKAEDLKHPQRSRILVGNGNMVVDHQNVFAVGRRL